MAWIGLDDAEQPRPPGPPAQRCDWPLRVHIDGRVVEARILDSSERDVRRYARRLAGDCTLTRI